MHNIFVEGIQGTGKSTLLSKLHKQMPEYKVYREGDISPIELAWCSYMTDQQYEDVCMLYSDIRADLEEHSISECNKVITAYTQILTDIQGFHKFMEKFEIYNGNVKFNDFKNIIFSRYSNFSGVGNIFECSFFQNIIECMMLFYQMSDQEITDFYSEAFTILKSKNFKLLYIETQDVANTLDTIKRERVDEQGNEIWFSLMLQYLANSPYGKEHNLRDFDGLVFHLNRRKELEHSITEKIIGKNAYFIETKNYDIDKIIFWCNQ